MTQSEAAEIYYREKARRTVNLAPILEAVRREVFGSAAGKGMQVGLQLPERTPHPLDGRLEEVRALCQTLRTIVAVAKALRVSMWKTKAFMRQHGLTPNRGPNSRFVRTGARRTR